MGRREGRRGEGGFRKRKTRVQGTLLPLIQVDLFGVFSCKFRPQKIVGNRILSAEAADSSSKMLAGLIGLYFFGGIVVSLWALFCFRDPYILVYGNNPIDDSLSLSSRDVWCFKDHRKDNLKRLFSRCWRKREARESD